MKQKYFQTKWKHIARANGNIWNCRWKLNQRKMRCAMEPTLEMRVKTKSKFKQVLSK